MCFSTQLGQMEHVYLFIYLFIYTYTHVCMQRNRHCNLTNNIVCYASNLNLATIIVASSEFELMLGYDTA
jgi:hypothetical protein